MSITFTWGMSRINVRMMEGYVMVTVWERQVEMLKFRKIKKICIDKKGVRQN